MIRMIAAVRTAVVAMAWLAGLPGLLMAVGGNPIPASPPSAASVQAWLNDPLLPQYVPETVKIITWLIWVLTAGTILTVGMRRARRWQWARLTAYLPGPVQGLAATLLGAAAATTAAVPAANAVAPVAVADTPAPSHTGAGNTATPSGAAAHTGGTDRPQVHRVKRGDTLWDIADDSLGDPQRWRDIYRLNRGVEQPDGSALTHPGMIKIGWTLALPRTAPPQQPPDTAPEPAPQEPADPTSPASAPTSPASSLPTVATSPSASPTSAAASGSDHTPRCSDTPADSAGPADAPGVDLAGGWVALPLAAGLLTATAMVWRRRRHRYRPTPIAGPRLDDPDLLPPLAAMTRIRTSMRRAAPATLDEQPAPTVREYRAAVVKPVLPPVGPSGSDLAGAAELPLSIGLGLTGDGALDAARGLLVATLASGSDDDPDAKGQAIVPAATLATLLGVSAVDLGHLGRLTVTDSDADAITQLEEEIIRRSRLIADAQAADVQTWRDTDVHAEPLPQLLLIAEVPDPAWANRLVTTVRLGHRVDIGAAMIGDWPTGTTLTVASDGTTGNDDAPRLAVLDTAAAIEMLGMLREAHGDIGSPVRPEPPERPRSPAPTPTEPDVVEPDSGRSDDIAPPATATPATTNRLPVAVRVLGRPAVLDHDGQPSPGIRSKAIELLVYLAVNRHGADLSDIMEALYPDATIRRAGERLSTVVADLRKHIRQAAAAPGDTEQPRRQRLEPIPNTGSRYHLDPAIVRVDWWTVLDHYEATATATDDDQRLAHLTAAIEAAGGALAESVEYDWIDTDREVVRRHRITLHAHAAALLADTDPHQSWHLLEQACQIDPISDELARTTMHAAAALGDADAIRHRLKTLRDALDAHGLELSDDTESLAHELLRQRRPPRPSE